MRATRDLSVEESLLAERLSPTVTQNVVIVMTLSWCLGHLHQVVGAQECHIWYDWFMILLV